MNPRNPQVAEPIRSILNSATPHVPDTPMWNGIRIVTGWRKPIPRSDHDWTATTDNYEPGHPMGYGSTEAGAIADLIEQLEDDTAPDFKLHQHDL